VTTDGLRGWKRRHAFVCGAMFLILEFDDLNDSELPQKLHVSISTTRVFRRCFRCFWLRSLDVFIPEAPDKEIQSISCFTNNWHRKLRDLLVRGHADDVQPFRGKVTDFLDFLNIFYFHNIFPMQENMQRVLHSTH